MMTEKPIAIVIPSWNPNEPRFKVEDCPQCGEDRQFKNGKCVYNQRLGLAYNVDEIVEVLNNTELEDMFKILQNNLSEKLKLAEPLQIPFHKLNWGDDKGYWRGYCEALREIQKVIE